MGIAYAQEKKPNLEETVKYINDIVSVSIGVINDTGNYYSYVEQQKFSLNEVTVEEIDRKKDNTFNLSSKYVYTNINWNTFDELTVDTKRENITQINVVFKQPFNFHYTDNNEDSRESVKKLNFWVINSKLENVKKALLRLKELTYKKDLFE